MLALGENPELLLGHALDSVSETGGVETPGYYVRTLRDHYS